MTLNGDQWILGMISTLCLGFIFQKFFKRLLCSLANFAPEHFCSLEISTTKWELRQNVKFKYFTCTNNAGSRNISQAAGIMNFLSEGSHIKGNPS